MGTQLPTTSTALSVVATISTRCPAPISLLSPNVWNGALYVTLSITGRTLSTTRELTTATLPFSSTKGSVRLASVIASSEDSSPTPMSRRSQDPFTKRRRLVEISAPQDTTPFSLSFVVSPSWTMYEKFSKCPCPPMPTNSASTRRPPSKSRVKAILFLSRGTLVPPKITGLDISTESRSVAPVPYVPFLTQWRQPSFVLPNPSTRRT